MVYAVVVGEYAMEGKFVRHPYLRSRASSYMQRWIDAFFEQGGPPTMVEEVAAVDEEDFAELEVTFFPGGRVWK